MTDYLLPKALSCLTTSELTQIQKELDKDISAKGEKLLTLFKYLRKNCSEMRKKNLLGSRSMGAKYLQKPKLRTALLSLINQKMIETHLEKHKIQYCSIVAEKWSEKIATELIPNDQIEEYGLNLFENATTKWQNEIDELKEGVDKHKHQFELNKLTFEAQHTNRDKYDLPYLSDMENDLDHIYVIQKLRLLCDQVLRSKYLKEESNIVISPLLNDLALQLAKTSRLIQLYLDIFHILNQDEVSLANLKNACQTLQESANEIDSKQVHILLRNLTNCCIGQYMGNNNKEYLKLQLEIEKWGIENKVLIYEDNLSDNLFLNIINSACALGELALANQFIKDYERLLIIKYRETSVSLAQAYIYFFQRRYQEALDQVEKINTRLPRFMIRRKSLKLRICFELLLKKHSSIVYDDLKSLCLDFQNFIKRDTYKLSEKRKEAYLNFITFVKELNQYIEFKPENPDCYKAQLLQDLKKQRAIAEEWLLEKINQLD